MMFSVKNIEMAHDSIYAFLENEGYSLSTQISLPIPDICEGTFVDKYIVYEDVAFENKHIVFSPEWIFTFADQDMVANEKCSESDTKYEYSIQKSIAEMQENIQEYLHCYERIREIEYLNEKTPSNGDLDIWKCYIKALNNCLPKTIIEFYKSASNILRNWSEK